MDFNCKPLAVESKASAVHKALDSLDFKRIRNRMLFEFERHVVSKKFVDSSSANLTNEDFENVEREDEFGQPPLIVDRADKFETLCYSVDD